MRIFNLILFLGLLHGIVIGQADVTLTEKRNIYNEKGDYYFDKQDYKKAIVFYNMAFTNDENDYFSVLKKAEAFEKLNLYPQAEECYRIVFETNLRIDNSFRLKYAYALLANNKPEEFKKVLGKYSQLVEAEIKSKNILVSQENRSKLYKDSTIIIVTEAKESADLKTYKSGMQTDAVSGVNITGFDSKIYQATYSADKSTMYFTAQIPGGQGGKDIYKSVRINNEWTKPENLGSTVNTSGNEEYPLIIHDSILYFSSNRKDGFGGSDIYSINLKSTEKQVVNLGNQINTKYNDYGLYLSTEGKSGFFTSDKPHEQNKENVFAVDILNFKMKYAGYRYRSRTSMEKDKINLIVSNGEEYNIAPKSNGDFEFSFQPVENYKVIIQRENIEVNDVLNNTSLSPDEKKKNFLTPPPLQKADIIVPYGMKYKFSAGANGISEQYKKNLRAKASEYQAPDNDVISLTALAKELEFTEGEIYTIRFVRDESKLNMYKGKDVTTLYVNDQTVNLYRESFFILLPQETEANFNIQTDLETIDEKYNAKKYALVIDEGSVFEGKETAQDWLISLTVNTNKSEEVLPVNQLSASEISIFPGIEYILTLSKTDISSGENIEIIVPLTRGVKYNLTSAEGSAAEYKEALAEFLTGRQGVQLANEEVIDISLLSKELEVIEGEDLSFNLLPVKQFGKKPEGTEDLKSSLTLDGKIYEISRNDKYIINVPFNVNRKVNIQTDLEFVQNNFNPNEFTLDLDTISFTSEIIVDTTGYSKLRSSGWLVSMSVNTDSVEEVEKQNQFLAKEVSIIPGKEYILTVSKIDAITGEKIEIIIPLIRQVKYDFTTNPESDEEYMESLKEFLAGQEEIETIDGTLIDITLLSKELQIREGDEISFSILPVKDLLKKPEPVLEKKSSLYLDNKIIEFTELQKYTIDVPLNSSRVVNMQTDLEHIQENFEPGTFTLDVDTIEFFSEIVVDTTGYGDRVVQEEKITDPVFDVVIVNFDLNQHTLQPVAKEIIQSKVIDELKKDDRLYVTIKGYTDALGNADYNLKLSKNRAESVKKFLEENGIGGNRIRTFSFGESAALKAGVDWEDLSEEELKKHRKVEIVIYLPK